MLNAVL